MNDVKEVLNALIENLYFSMSDELEVYRKDKLARAYFIAKQLWEFGTVDLSEVEANVEKAVAK